MFRQNRRLWFVINGRFKHAFFIDGKEGTHQPRAYSSLRTTNDDLCKLPESNVIKVNLGAANADTVQCTALSVLQQLCEPSWDAFCKCLAQDLFKCSSASYLTASVTADTWLRCHTTQRPIGYTQNTAHSYLEILTHDAAFWQVKVMLAWNKGRGLALSALSGQRTEEQDLWLAAEMRVMDARTHCSIFPALRLRPSRIWIALSSA